MGNLFTFKSIKAKVLSGFIFILIILILFSGFIYLAMDKMRDDSEDIVDKQLPLLITDSYFANNMEEVRAELNLYLLTGDPNVKEKLETVLGYGEEIGENLLKLSDDAELQEAIEQKEDWETYVTDAVAAYDDGNKEKALTIVEQSVTEADAIGEKIDNLKSKREELITDAGKSTVTNANDTVTFTIILNVIIFIISIVIALATANTISKPIIKVMNRMNEVAKGVLNFEPLQTNTKDETAKLTDATNTMVERNRALLQKISEVSTMVSSQSEELTQSANEVKTGTEQIASTMEELASGAEIQANSASDLTNYMSTFTTTIDHTHHNSEVVQKNSEEVLSMTNYGSELMNTSSGQMKKINVIVHESVEKMDHLNQRAQEVTKLVEVINDIAEQTNLLALNAAIEAARAGENGRGFAVVADEVRKLAEQVGLSVSDITTIVTNIQNDSKDVSDALEAGFKEVELGSDQIKITEETFQDITSKVDETVGDIQKVSNNLNEIVTNNEKMAKSIEEIASVSEESAAGVEETAASAEQSSSSMEEVSGSSQHLAKLAEELNGLVNKYQL